MDATIDSGLRRILSRWSTLETAAREATLHVDPKRLVRAMRGAVEHEHPEIRFGVVRAMVDLGDPCVCEDMIAMIGDRDSHVARGAERALVALARGAPDRKDVAWAAASTAVVDAAGRFGERHMSRGVLLASMLMTTPRLTGPASALQSPLAKWLAGESHPGHAALRTVLRRNPDPRLRSRALAWLRWEPVAVSALARVMRGVSAEDHEALLVNSHLALHPQRGHRLAATAISTKSHATWPEECALPDAATFVNLSHEARRALPRFAAIIAADSQTLTAVLNPALADPDATVRWRAATTLPLHAVEDFCFDADATVARAALLRRSAIGDVKAKCSPRPADARLARRLVRHPDPAIRAIARQESVDIWNAESVSGRLAARRLLATHRAVFVHDVRVAMRDPDRGMAAITMARVLNVAGEFEDELRDLAITPLAVDHAPAMHLAAAAASALGDVATAGSVTTLLGCLNHADDRVRANAVEALARHMRIAERHGQETPSLAATLLELKSDPSHRVRANAIRALFRQPRSSAAQASTARALSNMLADDRAMHRVAGLWVVDRAIVAGVDRSMGDASIHIALALDTLARSDIEPKVRLRAAQCAGRMLGATRESWSRRAANVIIEPKGMTHAAA